MENKNFLPKNLHSILIGIMLGDGHLYKSSPTSNTRFEISFGKDRESFANWIGNLFKIYSNTGIKKIVIKNKKTPLTLNHNFRFKTKSMSVFNSYYNIFYKLSHTDPDSTTGENNYTTGKYKKIVPLNIVDLMDPAVLAYLIMTDGNFDKARNRVRIYTNSFTKAEVESLAEAIYLNFNIYTGVLLDRKDQWILTIGAKQLDLLREIVRPHFEPSMLYRIGL